MRFGVKIWNLHAAVIFFLALTVCRYAEAVSQQVTTKTLFDDLMTDYDSNLIPVCSSGSNVTLNIDMALRQILEMNEREQLLTTNLWMRLAWNDCRLTWNSSSYNLTSIMLSYNDIWLPDITLYDSAAEEVMFPGIENFQASISSSGSVTYNFPTVVKSICRANVYYFPFDSQKCSLQFGSWTHHGLELDIVNRNPNGDLDSYIKNSEWAIKKLPAERHVLYYNCCPEPYPDVTYYIVMTRRPSFYLLTMIFPCILVSFVAALGFLLPVESGEKVSLEITVLLSLAVFLLLVSESMPPSSDNFPIIGSYFASSMVLVALSLLQTVCVLNAFYRGTNGRKVPRWARKFFFNCLAKALCMKPSNKVRFAGLDRTADSYEMTESTINGKAERHKHRRANSNAEKPQVTNEFVNAKDPVADLVQRLTDRLKDSSDSFREHTDEAEWRDLSNILDRVFLIFYVVTTVVTTMALLLRCVVES